MVGKGVCSLLFIVFFSMFGHADTFEVSGKTIVVPAPKGFVRVTEGMTSLHRFVKRVAEGDTWNDTLAFYIMESVVPLAMEGGMPELERWFILKVGNSTRDVTTGKAVFAEIKKVTRTSLAETLRKAKKKFREDADRINTGVSREFDLNYTMDIGQVIPMAPHYESDNEIAYSMFANYAIGVDEEEASMIVSGTTTMLNVAGKLLSLYSFGQKGDLEWTRSAGRGWAAFVTESNPPSPLDSSRGGTIDWGKVAGKGIWGGLAGGLLAGLFALIAIFRRWRSNPNQNSNSMKEA